MAGSSGCNIPTIQMAGQRPFHQLTPNPLAGRYRASPQPAEQWNDYLRYPHHQPQLRQLPPHTLRPMKGCLKVSKNFQALARHSTSRNNYNKHINFASSPHCLITGSVYAEHPQDGKAWRRQQAHKTQHENTARQAISGSQEYWYDVAKDPWADQGWEPLGLGEDTPMEGVSAEMDAEVAKWMDYEALLEEQHAVAESNRFVMQQEIRRFHGADLSMETSNLVRLRLEHMRSR